MKVIILFVALIAAALSCPAEDLKYGHYKGITAHQLATLCSYNKEPLTTVQKMSQLACLGYMQGWADAIDHVGIVHQDGVQMVLMADKTAPSVMRRALIDYIKKSEKIDLDTNDADTILAHGLFEAGLLVVAPANVPCVEEQKPTTRRLTKSPSI
jgi:hypothetical protein